jgi:hypothetical protein
MCACRSPRHKAIVWDVSEHCPVDVHFLHDARGNRSLPWTLGLSQVPAKYTIIISQKTAVPDKWPPSSELGGLPCESCTLLAVLTERTALPAYPREQVLAQTMRTAHLECYSLMQAVQEGRRG